MLNVQCCGLDDKGEFAAVMKAPHLQAARERGRRDRGSTIWLHSSRKTTSKCWSSRTGRAAEQHVTPTTAAVFSFLLRFLSAPALICTTVVLSSSSHKKAMATVLRHVGVGCSCAHLMIRQRRGIPRQVHPSKPSAPTQRWLP